MSTAARAYQCLSTPSFHEGEFALRPVQPSDIEAIRQWRNSQLEILRQARPICPDQQRAYFAESVWPDFASEQPRNILLTFEEGGQPIGYGGLVHIAWEHARSEISFLLDPNRAHEPQTYHPRFATFLRLIRQVAFNDLGLHRLFTETYAFRLEHIETLERSGFIREGAMRHHVNINGRPVDSIVHGCLNPGGAHST